ncbi:MAG: hypothetical protein ACJ76J_15045 [Thermoanaerobaculia bacterium]
MSDPEKEDPVGEAQADAEQAKTEEDKALADPQADLNQTLDSLRTIEVQLYGIEVVQQVQQLSDAQKQEFASARLHLTSVINQLDTAQLSEIEGKLEQNDAALQQGIQSLEKSLGDLTAAPEWAGAVNDIIGVIGQIIPLV